MRINRDYFELKRIIEQSTKLFVFTTEAQRSQKKRLFVCPDSGPERTALWGFTALSLLEGLLALGPDRGKERGGKRNYGSKENPEADRAAEKDRRIAAGEEHGAPEVLLHHRPEDHGQQHGRRLAIELGEEIAQDPEQGHEIDVELAVAEAEHADGAEDENRRVEQVVGHHAEPHPEPDHGQVQHQQEEVPDPHRGDDAPEERGLIGHHGGPGLNALDDHRADHEGHDRACRDAEGEHRDEGGLGPGVVRRLGRSHPLDGALPELGGMLRDLLLHGIGGEGGEQGPAAREGSRGTNRGPSPGGWARSSASNPPGSA